MQSTHSLPTTHFLQNTVPHTFHGLKTVQISILLHTLPSRIIYPFPLTFAFLKIIYVMLYNTLPSHVKLISNKSPHSPYSL